MNFSHEAVKQNVQPLDVIIIYNIKAHTAQGLNILGPFANIGSLPTRGVGRLPGPLSDELWCNLKNAETPAMVLIEGEFPLTCFLTTASLFKRETKVSSVYTWTDDTAEGV